MNPGTIPLHIQAPLSAPMNSSRMIDGMTGDMLDIKDCSICFQEILYTPIPIAAAIPAEASNVSWLAPESVSTPNEITEKDSIVIKATKGMKERQMEGNGISACEEVVFICNYIFIDDEN